jgi:hypothetical protein
MKYIAKYRPPLPLLLPVTLNFASRFAVRAAEIGREDGPQGVFRPWQQARRILFAFPQVLVF